MLDQSRNEGTGPEPLWASDNPRPEVGADLIVEDRVDRRPLPLFRLMSTDELVVRDAFVVVDYDGRSYFVPRGETEAWAARVPPSTVTPGGLDPVDRDDASYLVHRTTIGNAAVAEAVAGSASASGGRAWKRYSRRKTLE